MEKKYSIGSLFAGIGGFELGLERAIPGAYTLWQVEQDNYCKKVLSKHWPEATIYDDVRNITKNNTKQVDILCGGFPCQDISVAGKGEGLHGKKSGLWWEMHRIIGELRPRIAILENVANVLSVGGPDVIGSLAQIGYDCEWTVIRASDFGAPHNRARWFCVAYPNSATKTKPRKKGEGNTTCKTESTSLHKKNRKWKEDKQSEDLYDIGCNHSQDISTHSNSKRSKKQSGNALSMEEKRFSQCRSIEDGGIHNRNYWESFPTQSPICRRDDGIPNRVDRLRALGNAIVPQCSEWIGKKLWESGILQSSN